MDKFLHSIMTTLAPIPRLDLSLGQLTWILSDGQPPSRTTLDQLRYLRLLGVPFSQEEAGRGRGHRLSYGFYDLIECGLGLFAIRRGLKPKEAATFLLGQRPTLRTRYAACYGALRPESLRRIPPLTSSEPIPLSFGPEEFIRLHTRYSETPLRYEFLGPEALLEGGQWGDPRERFSDGGTALPIPLGRMMRHWLALAQEAPEVRPGPK